MNPICVKCCRNMRPSKTGVDVKFDRGGTIRGDEYACPDCGSKVVIVSPNTQFHTPSKGTKPHITVKSDWK